MTPFAQTILASMIAIISPGQSVYSQVPLDVCDENCQKTLVCSNASDWRCKAPTFSQLRYEEILPEYSVSEEGMAEARLHSFTRAETYEEGLIRYAITAQAIANVSEKATRHLCIDKCRNIAEETQCSDEECESNATNELKTCETNCSTNSPWTWPRKELAYMLIVASSQESGFRADVHGGTGYAGRGDCQWAFSNGKKAPVNAKGAHVVLGTCRSVCLAQINIGTGKTKEGWSADDLTGIDLQSTERCFTVAARTMANSRRSCAMKGSGKNWVKETFAAYGSGGACKISMRKVVHVNGGNQIHYAYKVSEEGKTKIVWAPYAPDNAVDRQPVEDSWPGQRAQMYSTYSTKQFGLDQSVLDTLARPEIDAIFQFFMQTSVSTNWMQPVHIVQPAS